MVQRGKRAVYDADANAYEKATPTNEDEFRRKVRMFEHCWAIVLEGKMLRHLRPLYLVEVISHRHLRYASGVLHLVLLGSSIALVGHGVLLRRRTRPSARVCSLPHSSESACRATYVLVHGCDARFRSGTTCAVAFPRGRGDAAEGTR